MRAGMRHAGLLGVEHTPEGLIETTCSPDLTASSQIALPTNPLPPNTTSLGHS
jgi:hypothetical protein